MDGDITLLMKKNKISIKEEGKACSVTAVLRNKTTGRIVKKTICSKEYLPEKDLWLYLNYQYGFNELSWKLIERRDYTIEEVN